MTDTVQEGNKLIAEFMGYIYFAPLVHFDEDDMPTMADIFSKVPIKVKTYDGVNYFEDLPNPDFGKENPKEWNSSFRFIGWDTMNNSQYIYNLKYHTSWEWLMPVVEKINSTPLPEPHKRADVIIWKNDCHINDWDSILVETSRGSGESLISVVWRAAVQFIQFYNQTK